MSDASRPCLSEVLLIASLTAFIALFLSKAINDHGECRTDLRLLALERQAGIVPSSEAERQRESCRRFYAEWPGSWAETPPEYALEEKP